jgi:hypothetical protein
VDSTVGFLHRTGPPMQQNQTDGRKPLLPDRKKIFKFRLRIFFLLRIWSRQLFLEVFYIGQKSSPAERVRALGSMLWAQFSAIFANFRRFSPIFGEKFGVFL